MIYLSLKLNLKLSYFLVKMYPQSCAFSVGPPVCMLSSYLSTLISLSLSRVQVLELQVYRIPEYTRPWNIHTFISFLVSSNNHRIVNYIYIDFKSISSYISFYSSPYTAIIPLYSYIFIYILLEI